MRFLILLAFLFSGCSTHMRIAGKNFSNTNSPCMDGILSNIDYAGCKSLNISQVPGENVYRVRCEDSTDENQWTSFTFYFSSPESVYYRDDWAPLCMDPTTNIFYVPNPNNTLGATSSENSVLNQKVPGTCFNETDDTYRQMGACEFESAMPDEEDHCYEAWVEKYRTLFPQGCRSEE